MDLGTAKTKALQLIREYSNNGSVIGASQNADYLLSMNNIADMAQKEIAQVKRIHVSYSISQNPILNLLGMTKGFDMEQHLDTDHITTQGTGAKSYYFEVDRQSTIYIEEKISGVWTLLSTITVPSTVISFTAYKGLITPSSTLNVVRVRFSGSYPYNIRNRALYAYNFPDADAVPDYRPFVRYELPDDFMDMNRIGYEYDPRQYVSLSDYKREGRKTLLLNIYLKGSFLVQYYRLPTTITSTTLDSYIFEVDEDAAQAIPYYIASHVIIDENISISTQFMNMYQSKLANLSPTDGTISSSIQNSMGW